MTAVLPRWVPWLLAVGVTVNVLLAAGFAVVGLIAVGNTSSIRNDEIIQCQLQNVARLQDVAIWDRLLSISAAQARAETPAQRAEVADLERLVTVKDEPRDCTAAYKP